MSSTIPLAQYLFTRLRQLGATSLHGVPGDYNLTLLDHVHPSGLTWIGTCNELNGGYSADAYSRIKGIGALVTTYGVGELSAINAVAGAMAELAPLVHIVGTPSRQLQAARAKVHHTFNDGEYGRFREMARHVTVAQERLGDVRLAAGQIDGLLARCVMESRPVYLEVPTDMVDLPVDKGRLEVPIRMPEEVVDVAKVEDGVGYLLERMRGAKRPLIYVDGESRAYGIVDQIHELIGLTQWPTWTAAYGKGLVDEDLPSVYGIYEPGLVPEYKAYFDSSDLILCFGGHFSNTNTYLYAALPNPSTTIFFNATSTTSNTHTFNDIPASHLLSKLIDALKPAVKADTPSISPPKADVLPPRHTAAAPNLTPSDPITQEHFYSRCAPLLRPADIVMGETGTAGYGVRCFKLPKASRLFVPVTWLSIGYMLPAALGAALAQRELYQAGHYHKVGALTHGDASKDTKHIPRTILFTGEGSLQMTIQEISTIIHHQLPLTIFVLNNGGYTIERFIHGRAAHYNDVAPWRYTEAPKLFGAGLKSPVNPKDAEGEYEVSTFVVGTWGELDDVLKVEKVRSGRGLVIVEVSLERLDGPEALMPVLKKQLEAEEGKGEKK